MRAHDERTARAQGLARTFELVPAHADVLDALPPCFADLDALRRHDADVAMDALDETLLPSLARAYGVERRRVSRSRDRRPLSPSGGGEGQGAKGLWRPLPPGPGECLFTLFILASGP